MITGTIQRSNLTLERTLDQWQGKMVHVHFILFHVELAIIPTSHGERRAKITSVLVVTRAHFVVRIDGVSLNSSRLYPSSLPKSTETLIDVRDQNSIFTAGFVISSQIVHRYKKIRYSACHSR